MQLQKNKHIKFGYHHLETNEEVAARLRRECLRQEDPCWCTDLVTIEHNNFKDLDSWLEKKGLARKMSFVDK